MGGWPLLFGAGFVEVSVRVAAEHPFPAGQFALWIGLSFALLVLGVRGIRIRLQVNEEGVVVTDQFFRTRRVACEDVTAIGWRETAVLPGDGFPPARPAVAFRVRRRRGIVICDGTCLLPPDDRTRLVEELAARARDRHIRFQLETDDLRGYWLFRGKRRHDQLWPRSADPLEGYDR